jgi:hypothetical protein
MENTGNLAAALAKARAAFEPIRFDSINPHFKSKFASLAAIMAATDGALSDNGIVPIFMPGNGPDGMVGGTMRLEHDSGEYIESAIYVPPGKHDAQGYGACLTYVHRYLLRSMLNVSADADDDGNGAVQTDPLKDHYEAVRDNMISIAAIKEALHNNDYELAFEAIQELDHDTQKSLWVAPTKGGIAFSTEERAKMKSNEWAEARNAMAEKER